jgi:cysteine desulfurase / selenocysteine lyase
MVNFEQIRLDFPVTKHYTYLANAAISPIPMQVFREASGFHKQILDNGGVLWDKWIGEMEETRELYARFISAKSDEIGFTHSTSEGMNIIAHMLSSKGRVVSNELEFPSSLLPWYNKKADIYLVKEKGGKILTDDIAKAVNEKTRTVVVSHVQYATGFRQDLVELAELTKKKRLYLVVNATQSLGALNFDVGKFAIDFMSCNGHKWILSSFGIGAIYLKKEYLESLTEFQPPFFSQFGQKQREIFENRKLDISYTASRFELGSPHFSNILSLKAGLKYISRIGIAKVEKRILSLTKYVIKELQKLKLVIISPIEEEKNRSGIVVFKVTHANELVKKLEKEHIIVSARGGGIRISPHFYNNEQDIDKLISKLRSLI